MARSARPPEGSAEADAVLLPRLAEFLSADKILSAPVAWTEMGGASLHALDLTLGVPYLPRGTVRPRSAAGQRRYARPVR
jgi:hypothetical protein